MGPVVSAKLREDVAHVRSNGGLANKQLIGNLLIAISRGNQPKYIDFTLRQVVVRSMFGKFCGSLWGYSLLSGMDCANGIQKFSVYMPLQNVCPRTRFHSPYNLGIARIGRQYDARSFRDLTPNLIDRLDSIQIWHFHVH